MDDKNKTYVEEPFFKGTQKELDTLFWKIQKELLIHGKSITLEALKIRAFIKKHEPEPLPFL